MANSGYLCTCADAPAAPSARVSGTAAQPCASCRLTFIAPLSSQRHEMAFWEVEARDLFRANLFSTLWELGRSGRSFLGVLSMAPGLCGGLGETKVTH